MIDITMAYPGSSCEHPSAEFGSHDQTIGIPAFGYGQSYYTLRSIFCDRLPPPAIYMHIRKFMVATDVPVGNISGADHEKLPNGLNGSANPHGHTVEVEIPEDERQKFDSWLRDLWREKDKCMSRYLETGFLVQDAKPVEIPLELRTKREVLDAFCFFIPALLGWVYTRFS